MHELALPLLIGLIAVALAFDFLNGLHDAANSIATVVGTRLIGPVAAVALRRLLQLRRLFPRAALAATPQGRRNDRQGPDRQGSGDPGGGVRGAGRGDVLERRYLGEGHSLVVEPRARRGIIGAGVAHAGFHGIQWLGLNKTLIAIVLSPVLGLSLTMGIMLATSWLGVRATARGAERAFRGLHLMSAGAYSLGHGLNDAQKTMGVITVLLYSTGYLHGEFRGAELGRLELLHRDGPRHDERGLADHRDDGLQDHQAVAASGLFGLARRLGDAVRRLLSRHPGVDHAHHRRLHDRRRRRAPRLGGALGRWPGTSSWPG